MEVTPELVKHLAELSRLRLSEEEVEKIIPELRSVLGYFERISDLDVDELEELVRPIFSANVLRPDVPAAGLEQDEALAMAPEKQDGFFKLPRVVEEGR
ncbi:Asp-tRNA(Asn)/Glu-tRNA(Gln) amidotransferase subunit GatC [Oceanithermus sp.]